MNTTNTQTAIEALASFLSVDVSDIPEESCTHYDLPIFSIDGAEYAVGNEEEAYYAWDQALDSYFDDCIQPELDKIPGNLGKYFDLEAWKNDARHDGRGHSLAPYDGDENKEGDFFIYRIN